MGGVHAVHIGERADFVGDRSDGGNIGASPEHVAGCRHCHQLGARANELRILLTGQRSVGGIHFGPADRCARMGGRLHPWSDVGVMIELGYDHLVARTPGFQNG